MEKFDKDLEEIKTELNNIKLSDDFKNNLKIKMEEELNKSDIKEKARNLLFPRKLVATFACFFLLITSCAVFADEIESFVANIFSNTDRKIEEAIANGNYKEIDMEYVEHDGIGIKVDYIVQEEDSLCIAFNVKSEEEFEDVILKEIEVKNQENELLYSRAEECNDTIIMRYKKTINKKNCLVIYEIENLKDNEKEIKKLLFDINKITFLNGNYKNIEYDNFKFEINM